MTSHQAVSVIPSVAAAAPSSNASASAEPAPWSLGTRVAFRFSFCYLALFCVPIIATQVTGIDGFFQPIGAAWVSGCAWIARHVLGVTHELKMTETGSGDRLVDWVGIGSAAAIAMVATIVWSILDRRRRQYVRLHEALRVLLRYTVAFVLLGYGVSKLFLGQFSPPGPRRLLQQYGDSSPMGLLWAFMGTSPAYIFFSGFGETLGAVLLLFRRTTTLGAMVLAGVLTNVVMLNFCYDVPVKINSSHYLAMCLFLMLPDLRRLGDVLIFQRPTVAPSWRHTLPRRWMRIAHPLVKYGVIGVLGALLVRDSYRSHQESFAKPESKSWIDGYWSVSSFRIDGQLVEDNLRWRRLKFEVGKEGSSMRWHYDHELGPLCSFVVDETGHTLTLKVEADPYAHKSDASRVGKRYPLTMTRSDADHLHIEGTIDDKVYRADAERLVPEKSRLLSRGFHWISEVPFNR